MKAVPLLVAIAPLGIMSACGDDGQWSGTTSQGRAITFSLSLELKVAAPMATATA
jgi:hypothetical protein